MLTVFKWRNTVYNLFWQFDELELVNFKNYEQEFLTSSHLISGTWTSSFLNRIFPSLYIIQC